MISSRAPLEMAFISLEGKTGFSVPAQVLSIYDVEKCSGTTGLAPVLMRASSAFAFSGWDSCGGAASAEMILKILKSPRPSHLNAA